MKSPTHNPKNTGSLQPAVVKAAPEYEKSAKPNFGAETALNPNNARQGVTGHGVRFVLAFSLLAAAAAFLWLIFWVY